MIILSKPSNMVRSIEMCSPVNLFIKSNRNDGIHTNSANASAKPSTIDIAPMTFIIFSPK